MMTDDAPNQHSEQSPFYRKQDEKVVAERLIGKETVLAASRIHLAIYWKSVALFIIGLIFGVAFAVELAFVICGFALIFLLTAFLRAQILLAVVTNKRMMTRYGLLMVDVVDIHFDKIESIELERMLPGYLFGYANLVIMGTGNRLVVIPYVANGAEVRKAYNATVLKDKD